MKIAVTILAVVLHGAVVLIFWTVGGSELTAGIGFVLLFAFWTWRESSAQSARFSDANLESKQREIVFGATLCVLIALAALTADVTLFGAMAGSGLFLIGVRLRCLAIRELESSFHDAILLSPTQSLKTDGLFAHLRHPSEAGTVYVAIGAALYSGSPWTAGFFVVVVVPQIFHRVRSEDRMLANTFGTAFRQYAHQTPAIVPQLEIANHLLSPNLKHDRPTSIQPGLQLYRQR